VGGPVLSVPGDRDDDDQSVVYRPGMTMAQVEKSTIAAALEATKGNRRRAAEQLGIGERTLYRKIKEYGLN
jgi:DNA-binding NtrC family response regulator